ncbi:hypothetical protein [Serpentinicella alkaliphila]|uniref:CheY-specific phosphatase CheX n=1 Tax=Serpentinicella alkaliphila TaxID=1734049 RepID=A0A4R2TJE6_9FIRM|nr:hypothetical protein [Serpentinicella alkaliphila]QUH25012.1 hypothetical protein HZR23_03880 [Serpentinicella alkaliphila]TCQ02507.1 CheY-specific phosphatase CheX [Serpentinicella alkaliphila]
MLHQYFGNFLLNKGFIDAETLNKVLDKNRSTRVKLGILAMDNGFMNAEQVNKIHNIQKQTDKRFGEIAVELGYLSEADVEDLLKQQKIGTVQLSQSLLDLEIFTIEKLEEILNLYNEDVVKDNSLTHLDKGPTYELVSPLIKSQYDLSGIISLDIVCDFVTLFYRKLVRFVDSESFLNTEPNVTIPENIILAKQGITGDYTFNTYLGMDENTYIKFASAYSKINITQRDELADAAVSEYLNLTNGLFTLNMADENYIINLTPPTTLTDFSKVNINKNILVPFMTKFGQVFLIVQGLI